MNTITVEKLIANKPFLFEENPIISGRGGLKRYITNINVMEVPDVYRWVREGDLLLTTAFSIKDNEQAQEELIPKLSEAGIAAIGIKTGRYLKQVPERMIEMSEKYDFPILSLNFNIGYSQTISEVLNEIMNQEAKWLSELHLKIQLLTKTVMMGENMRTIVETIAQCMEMNAAILLHTNESFSTDAAVRFKWPDLSRMTPSASGEDGFLRAYRLEGDSEKDACYFPIERNSEVVAYLVCWSSGTHWSEYTLFLQHAVALLTLYLTKQQALHDIEDSHKDKFLKMWVLGEVSDRQTIVLNAAIVGMQLRNHYYVCITSKIGAVAYKDYARLRSLLVMQGIILVSLGSEWVLLVPAEGASGSKESFGRLLSDLRQTLKQPFIRMGISEIKSFISVHEGYQDALQVLELGSIIQPDEPICRFENLGMYPIVHLLADQKGINKRLFKMIEPLYDYDLKNQSKLVETLSVFLRHDGNVKEAAAKLFCHYNSVLYRLEKIQCLLKLDLKDPETKFQLQLALRVFEYGKIKGNL
ncbi:PucR family transcriptional regulator [Paenibacillus beijingensis]|uniref:PucR family transcriptional regulator n=1 Tax=Paenibacillus beijingensis TaxID=1126833 RepID=A0A0D5NLA4_9BACL|nr:PucR family transcriptional regulator ligand-binding domain-containing protein [Paenibacillus beijingensis]AJY75693.1 hypothetical protein VN24_15450 [Paenibacillus beijingensis]